MMNPIALPAFQDNYIWVIEHLEQQSMTCIDPGDAAPVLDYAFKHALKLVHIMLTHHHSDHIGGVGKLLEAFPNATVYAPDDGRIPFPKKTVDSDAVIAIDGFVFQVLMTPGHTNSHICYHEKRMNWLFCGDTLFSGGCGRVFDGTIEALHHSLHVLKNLPNQTEVYCGHEYTRQNLRFAATIEPHNLDIKAKAIALNNNPNPLSLPSTIEIEKKINPFFRTNSSAMHAYALKNGILPTDSLAIFKRLREEKNQFS